MKLPLRPAASLHLRAAFFRTLISSIWYDNFDEELDLK